MPNATSFPGGKPPAGTNTKKLDLSSFVTPKMDEAQAEKAWVALKNSIIQIHSQLNTQALSFQVLYNYSYNLVLNKYGPMLYNNVQALLKSHLAGLAKKVALSSDETMLKSLVDVWSLHVTTMGMIRDILMYCDRSYCVPSKKPLIYDMGLVLFKEELVRNPQIKSRLIQGILARFANARRGELVHDMDLIRHAVHMLAEVGVRSRTVYEEDFEQPFLEDSEAFFIVESQSVISKSTSSQYLAWAETKLSEERSRAHKFLEQSTEPKLVRVLERELIGKHVSTLLNMPGSDVATLMRDNKVADLKRMYTLFSTITGALDDLVNAVGSYVLEDTKAIVSKKNEDAVAGAIELCEALFASKARVDNVVKSCFNNDKNFAKTVKTSYETVMNADAKCASSLSVYVDDRLKTLRALKDDDQLDQMLDSVIGLFRLLFDKDVFESYYKSHLAKRLLSGKSVSDDAERAMLGKLKTECGQQFTSKLEAMFTDMKLSDEIQEQFRQQSQGNPAYSDIECACQVLTSGSWPAFPPSADVRLPRELLAWKMDFEAFYIGQHSGRRMTWIGTAGSCEVRGSGFASGMTHEFTVSLYEACMLVHFNDKQPKTLDQMCELVQIPAEEAKRQLISMAVPKFQLLNKSGSMKVLTGEDVFTVNGQYSSKLRKVKIPLVSARSQVLGQASGALSGTTELPTDVIEDRRFMIEAGIVRVMKSRKKLDHSSLVHEVTRQLMSRFNPTTQDIKKRIESLIEREYLERDPNDGRVYVYMA